MIDPDVLDDWYNSAKMVVEYEPEATLWDLFRYKMMWEHGDDIDTVIEEGFEICVECGEKVEIHAKGKCVNCYSRLWMREKRNEAK